jgi:hypothetical protein
MSTSLEKALSIFCSIPIRNTRKVVDFSVFSFHATKPLVLSPDPELDPGRDLLVRLDQDQEKFIPNHHH